MFQEFPEDNKGDDFLNEFRQKIADQSSANLEERRNELKRSKKRVYRRCFRRGIGRRCRLVYFGAAICR